MGIPKVTIEAQAYVGQWPPELPTGGTHMEALAGAYEGAGHALDELGKALDKIRGDGDLTPQGKARRTAEAAQTALKALAEHRAKVEHTRQWGRQLDADVKRQALGKEPSTERLFIRRELRDWLRGLSDSERTAAVGRALMSEDLDVIDAVRSAPAALNLFDAATVEMVEDYTPADLDPNTRAMLDGSRAINEGVALADRAITNVERVIRERAGVESSAADLVDAEPS